MSSYELRRGKYARLDAPGDDDVDTPIRFSTESNGTLEDLEEHDPLAFDSKLKRKKSAGDLKVRKASYKDAEFATSTPFTSSTSYTRLLLLAPHVCRGCGAAARVRRHLGVEGVSAQGWPQPAVVPYTQRRNR
jgi:hypothetical protein